MPQSTLTSKGQITLPAEVRRVLELSAGDKVDFVQAPGGGYLLVPVRTDVRSLRGRDHGCLRHHHPRVQHHFGERPAAAAVFGHESGGFVAVRLDDDTRLDARVQMATSALFAVVMNTRAPQSSTM